MSISGGTVTGGDGEGSRIIYNDNGSLPIPIRSGNYQFDGWFKAKAGGTKVTVDTVLTKDSTIYAHWTNTDGSGSMGGSGGSTGRGCHGADDSEADSFVGRFDGLLQ